jgi:putative transposase
MSRPKRLPAFDYRGPYVYSLTFCTFQRRPMFRDGALVARVRLSICQAAAERDFDVHAYTFMPDHLHLLVQGRTLEAELVPFVKLARQRSTLTTRDLRSSAGLWQDGYFERTLRKDEDVFSVAKYIAANPLRAGLVENARDWPFSGGPLVDAMTGRDV